MKGEIYLTINDLKEENKLLRKEKYELLIKTKTNQIEKEEEKIFYENLFTSHYTNLFDRSTQVAAYQQGKEHDPLEYISMFLNMDYLLKCDEINQQYQQYLISYERLYNQFESEKKKRKDEVRELKYHLISQSYLYYSNNPPTTTIPLLHNSSYSSSSSSLSQSNNQFSSSLSSLSSTNTTNLSLQTTTTTTNENEMKKSCLEPHSITINHSLDNISPHISSFTSFSTSTTTHDTNIISTTSSKEIQIQNNNFNNNKSSDLIIKLITERNYWKNQTISLRKEFKYQIIKSSIYSISYLKQFIYHSLPLQNETCKILLFLYLLISMILC